MEEKKNRNDEIEEEQDDIEEIDEVYSHMLEKSNRDKGIFIICNTLCYSE